VYFMAFMRHLDTADHLQTTVAALTKDDRGLAQKT
jgi:hypothetical protein